jgi:hypothetical protein
MSGNVAVVPPTSLRPCRHSNKAMLFYIPVLLAFEERRRLYSNSGAEQDASMRRLHHCLVSAHAAPKGKSPEPALILTIWNRASEPNIKTLCLQADRKAILSKGEEAVGRIN